MTMCNKTLLTAASLLACTAVVGSADAATIVYNFDAASAAVTSNDFGSGVTASSVEVSGADAVIGASGDANYNAAYDTNSVSLGLGRGPDGGPGVITWDVVIPNGVTIDLTALAFEFDYRSNNNSGNADVRQDWTLAISTGSGTPSTNSITGISNGIFEINTDENVALSGLTGLTATTVTFTITFDSGTDGLLTGGNATDRRTVIDSINLTGGLAVPEPGSLALLGLGGLLIARRRRD